jgi:hypothetical protein
MEKASVLKRYFEHVYSEGIFWFLSTIKYILRWKSVAKWTKNDTLVHRWGNIDGHTCVVSV